MLSAAIRNNYNYNSNYKKTMTYIVAEVGGNHDGDIENAKKLIQEAKKAGADAVKFQIYEAGKLVRPDLPAFTQAKGYRCQIDRFKDLEFTHEQWLELVDECKAQDIDFLATCFDIDSLNLYAPYMKYIKIASGDLTYKALIKAASYTGKPVIISTGMGSFEEIQEAASWVNPRNLTILHCVSAYPCPDSAANLGNIKHLQTIYKNVGYSDHTTGITACIAAAAMRATVIEKHFTLDNTLDYGDHPHSANPAQLKELVSHVRRIEKMGGYGRPECETETTRFRRGGYAARDMAAGEVITERDIVSLRPANLLKPHEYIGRTLTKDLKKGDSLDER